MNQLIRVLLVDDQVMVREMLAALLNQESDIKVVGQASNGFEAIEQTAALQPDVVLMDIQMPQLNGIDATRQIKDRCPHISIIALSSQGELAQIEAMQRAGAAAYVSKFDRIEFLLQAIHKLA